MTWISAPWSLASARAASLSSSSGPISEAGVFTQVPGQRLARGDGLDAAGVDAGGRHEFGLRRRGGLVSGRSGNLPNSQPRAASVSAGPARSGLLAARRRRGAFALAGARGGPGHGGVSSTSRGPAAAPTGTPSGPGQEDELPGLALETGGFDPGPGAGAPRPSRQAATPSASTA